VARTVGEQCSGSSGSCWQSLCEALRPAALDQTNFTPARHTSGYSHRTAPNKPEGRQGWVEPHCWLRDKHSSLACAPGAEAHHSCRAMGGNPAHGGPPGTDQHTTTTCDHHIRERLCCMQCHATPCKQRCCWPVVCVCLMKSMQLPPYPSNH